MSTKKADAAPGAAAATTYVDKEYTQRSLFLPSGRQLVIARARVSVPADDAEALSYLDQRPDFEPLTE